MRNVDYLVVVQNFYPFVQNFNPSLKLPPATAIVAIR